MRRRCSRVIRKPDRDYEELRSKFVKMFKKDDDRPDDEQYKPGTWSTKTTITLNCKRDCDDCPFYVEETKTCKMAEAMKTGESVADDLDSCEKSSAEPQYDYRDKVIDDLKAKIYRQNKRIGDLTVALRSIWNIINEVVGKN